MSTPNAQQTPPYLCARPGGVALTVKVVPGASRDRIDGPLGDALKIRVTAPPERGKANTAVVRLLARALGVAEQDVSVVRGVTSQRKTVAVLGVSVADVARRLGQG